MATVSYKSIKKQLPSGAQIQLGHGKDAVYFTAEKFRTAYCFPKNRWEFDLEEIRIYHNGKTSGFAPGDDDEPNDDTQEGNV
jgi:hypothetical protein